MASQETPTLPDDPRAEYAKGVTVWNDSGGVGKTTVTVNTASVLGRNGRNVLAIDLDPQAGGLTHHTGFKEAMTHPKYKLTDVLQSDTRTLEDITVSGEEHGVDFDVIPAHDSLGSFGETVAQNFGLEQNPMLLLRQAIKEAGYNKEYDVIIIDAPATRGKLVENAVAATRNVLIPTELTPKGDASVDGLKTYVKERGRKLRRDLDDPEFSMGVLAAVPNKCAKNGRLANGEKASLRTLKREHGDVLTPFYIPSRQVLSDAWENRSSLFEYAENTRELRPNEQILPAMFEMLAIVIEERTVEAIRDYEGNFPDLDEEVAA